MIVKKLYIHDTGDPSVGIFPTGWEAEVPIYIPDSHNMSEEDKESLDFFRNQMLEVYKEFAEGKLWAMYDFESEAEKKLEEEMEHQWREAEQKFDNPDML